MKWRGRKLNLTRMRKRGIKMPGWKAYPRTILCDQAWLAREMNRVRKAYPGIAMNIAVTEDYADYFTQGLVIILWEPTREFRTTPIRIPQRRRYEDISD